MGFFKRNKSDSHASRRNARIWLLQARRAAVIGIAAAAVLTGGIEAYASLQKLKIWVAQETLAQTAAAGFRVENILVSGRVHVSAAEVLAHLGVTRGEPIFGVDIDAVRQSLAALPWVKDARLSRRLPDTLVVTLEERTPAALWQNRGKLALIDSAGVLLTEENLEPWKALPLVVGGGAEAGAAALLGALDAEPAVATTLASAVRIEERRWDIRLRNGMTVKLPEKDMELALRRLGALDAEKKILARDIAVLDLRLPERVIVTPGTAEPTEKTKENKKT